MVMILITGVLVIWSMPRLSRMYVVAYFTNSNGVYVGDDVVILGVKVGQIEKIEAEPQRSKITFWIDDQYKVPADASAVMVSPKLITSRAIQLTPVYRGGAILADGAVIPQTRTAVPVEFDDLRQELEKLTDSLKPAQPGGVSPLGALINTSADNLRGEGANIRETLVTLSKAVSALGDHSGDIASTIKNLSTLISALHDSADLTKALNDNLAAVTALLANDPDEVAHAVTDLNTAIGQVGSFISENREAVGTTSDKLASVSKALTDSVGDVKQALHVLPNVLANLNNIYEPAHGALSGILAANMGANPINFLCGAIQAASRLNNEQSAKLCVQYLAPIVKNRQYNFLPFGLNPVVNAQARPNEITYSEDRLRPDLPPPATPVSSPPPLAAEPGSPTPGPPTPLDGPPLAAEATVSTNPAEGLPGLLTPPDGGGQ